jgi:outer membrane immunogenic protein
MSKVFASAYCVLLALSAPVCAADFLEAPSIDDWTGLFIGPNIGYAFGGDDRVGIHESENGPFAFVGDAGTLSVQGVFGGAQLGANLQTGQFVLGVEGDFELAGVDDHLSKTLEDGERASAESEVNWYGTARGRAGWTVDNVLFYGTGGLAFADVDYKVGLGDEASEFARLANNGTEIGYAVGAGVEYAVDKAWSVKFEYLYLNFGDEKVKSGDGDLRLTVETPDFHSLRFGLNYRF